MMYTIMSSLASYEVKQWIFVRSEVFTAMNMKNAIFWGVAQCRSCVNWHFGGTYCLHLQGKKNPWARNRCEQVAAVWPTQRHIPQDGILQRIFFSWEYQYDRCFIFYQLLQMTCNFLMTSLESHCYWHLFTNCQTSFFPLQVIYIELICPCSAIIV
jgi:hypothetical protein